MSCYRKIITRNLQRETEYIFRMLEMSRESIERSVFEVFLWSKVKLKNQLFLSRMNYFQEKVIDTFCMNITYFFYFATY